jgi:transketolase
MRTAFIRTLEELAAEDERVWLVVGDLGYSVVEPFRERFPERFVNAGVAEQNMVGLAAGLAHEGAMPFVYSIANFPTLRCLEQIRNDVCQHGLPVRVVAVGGGLAYGVLGASHHATEDLAVMTALPGMTVLAPADPAEARLATRALAGIPGPAYLRLGKAGEPDLHATPPAFTIGHPIRVRDGHGAVILATGSILGRALAAADLLGAEGVAARVVSVPTLKPLDPDRIEAEVAGFRTVVTVEEHGPAGGLAAAIAGVMSRAGHGGRLAALSLPDRFAVRVGGQEWMRDEAGLSAEAIAAAARG